MNQDPPNNVYDAFFSSEVDASTVRSVLMLLSTMQPEVFAMARERIDRETTIGPMLDPTAYLSGQRWNNAEEYKKLFSALESACRLSKGAKP